jgi:hypothetical protein
LSPHRRRCAGHVDAHAEDGEGQCHHDDPSTPACGRSHRGSWIFKCVPHPACSIHHGSPSLLSLSHRDSACRHCCMPVYRNRSLRQHENFGHANPHSDAHKRLTIRCGTGLEPVSTHAS